MGAHYRNLQVNLKSNSDYKIGIVPKECLWHKSRFIDNPAETSVPHAGTKVNTDNLCDYIFRFSSVNSLPAFKAWRFS